MDITKCWLQKKWRVGPKGGWKIVISGVFSFMNSYTWYENPCHSLRFTDSHPEISTCFTLTYTWFTLHVVFFRFISKKNVDTRRFKYMFTPTCKNYPIWLIVLRWVETTNELFFSFIDFGHDLIFGSHLLVVVFALLFSLLLLITLWRFSMVKSVIFPGNLRCMRWSGGICTISRP